MATQYLNIGGQLFPLPALPPTNGPAAVVKMAAGQADAGLLTQLADAATNAIKQALSEAGTTATDTATADADAGSLTPIEVLRRLGFNVSALGDNPDPRLVEEVLRVIRSCTANPQGKAADANRNGTPDPSTVGAMSDAAARTVRPDVVRAALQSTAEGRAYLQRQTAAANAGNVTKLHDTAAGNNAGGLSAGAVKGLSGTPQGRAVLKARGIRPVVF